MSKIRLMLCLIFLSILVGCANWPKILDERLSQLDKYSLVLATFTVHENNIDKTSNLLPFYLVIGKTGGKDYTTYRFPYPYGPFVYAKTDNNTSLNLLVLSQESGNYYFYEMHGEIFGLTARRPKNAAEQAMQLDAMGKRVPVVSLPAASSGFFKVPMLMNYKVEKNEILYIGNIHIIIKGSVIEVEINDKYETDMYEFEKVFPNLKGRNVVKKILPSWKIPSLK